MVKIRYIEFNGTAHSIDVQEGCSLMVGAVKNDLKGIDAECGGGCACATCHVHIDPNWMGIVAAPGGEEMAMLEFTEGANENSRLSCQIKVTSELDGLVVYLPESQK